MLAMPSRLPTRPQPSPSRGGAAARRGEANATESFEQRAVAVRQAPAEAEDQGEQIERESQLQGRAGVERRRAAGLDDHRAARAAQCPPASVGSMSCGPFERELTAPRLKITSSRSCRDLDASGRAGRPPAQEQRAPADRSVSRSGGGRRGVDFSVLVVALLVDCLGETSASGFPLSRGWIVSLVASVLAG